MADSGEIRQVTSVGMLKALADPVRLAILTALVGCRGELRVMAVKELAAELNEPQTKLYRHVKQLESAGLIRVAATRLVSGIVEQRYQACQTGLALGPEFMRGSSDGGQASATVAALLDGYLSRFLDRQAVDGHRGDGRDRDTASDMLRITATAVSPATAALIRGKLQEIADALDQQVPAEETEVPVEVLLGFLGPVTPAE